MPLKVIPSAWSLPFSMLFGCHKGCWAVLSRSPWDEASVSVPVTQTQLWNQAAEQWLEEPKNNSLCKTQRGLWLLKRSRKCSRNRVSVSSIHLPKVKRAAPHHSENGFALETAFLGIQEEVGARGTWPSWLFSIIDNFLCVAVKLDILQTLYSPYTHLWFEYGKYPQVHMLSAWSPAAVLFWEEVVMLGGRA